jgi:hypothetical protein
MGMEFFAEKDLLCVNFGGTEVIGKFSCISKDESLDTSFIVLKDAVMLLTQMTDKGLAHNMIDVSENGNFSSEVVVSAKNASFIRRVSPLGELYRKYLQLSSKIILT